MPAVTGLRIAKPQIMTAPRVARVMRSRMVVVRTSNVAAVRWWWWIIAGGCSLTLISAIGCSDEDACLC